MLAASSRCHRASPAGVTVPALPGAGPAGVCHPFAGRWLFQAFPCGVLQGSSAPLQRAQSGMSSGMLSSPGIRERSVGSSLPRSWARPRLLYPGKTHTENFAGAREFGPRGSKNSSYPAHAENKKKTPAKKKPETARGEEQFPPPLIVPLLINASVGALIRISPKPQVLAGVSADHTGLSLAGSRGTGGGPGFGKLCGAGFQSWELRFGN